MRIKSHNTIVLVVDYQEKLVPAMKDEKTFIQNSSLLLKGLSILNVPAVITQQYTKGLGRTIQKILDTGCYKNDGKGNDKNIFDKITFSAVENQEITKELEKLHADNIIVCGCEAHICVLQTCLDLKSHGYNVILVRDCIASRKEADKDAAIERARQQGIIITTYEAVLFEILGTAGIPEFKQISALIK